ncbi:hypothetical protein G6F36_013596 [Rhizopus arrhizus]|nr:hypothetical protein G6F36_013596 [Rhizopus arrhizus]
MSAATLFTVLDLKQAFHRLPLAEEHRALTAFTFNGQQYQFCRAPFGLTPIPNHFQRVLTTLLHDLPYVTCFIDDLTIGTGPDIEEHIKCVTTVIERLTSAKFILNVDKCHFMQTSVNILGFTISHNSLSLDSRKVANALAWPIPKTGKDIQRFLGLANYFRSHLPNFSTMTAPLDKLRNEGSLEHIWTDKYLQAFRNIQTALSNAPVLSIPDMRHELQLATDASNTGIGGVLYQIIDDKTRYIGFAARALSKSEMNYSTTKRELLAICYLFERFHKWLYGSHFTLYTDHKSLVYLGTQNIPNPMMLNWFETIFNYTFKVIHRPGIENVLPDSLSRLFSDDTEKRLGGDNNPQQLSIKNKNTKSQSKRTTDNSTSTWTLWG